MSVTNYIPSNCKYNIDRLDNVVYLIDEEAVKNIYIDNGEAYIGNITQTPMELKVYGITLSDTDELDERYKFTHTLTFSTNGYVNHTDFLGRYYAIVKSVDGEYWLVNPMFPSKVTYTYTIDSAGSHTDFTFSTISNFPTMHIHGMDKTKTYDCGYKHCTLKSLKLNDTKYSLHQGSHVTYTNNGFKDIYFNKKSCSFKEQFDGTNVQHKVVFNILFDDYKDSWHYNLLEFSENKYAAIIETSCGKFILTGFNFGLQPSFTVNANDQMSMDAIEIQLIDVHDNGTLVTYYDDITVEKDGTLSWEYTSDFGGYECVRYHTARYLLKAEVDALHNRTGSYMALYGYENEFPNLKIVDTFSTTEEFVNYSCEDTCKIVTTFPSEIVFNGIGSKQYTLNCDGDWSITSTENHIEFSPSSGSGGTDYTITVHNNLEPSDTPLSSFYTITYCDGKTITSTVKLKKQDTCLPQGDTYNITAEKQYLIIPTVCCVSSVASADSYIISTELLNSSIKLYVKENTTDSARTFTLTVTYCDSRQSTITINQDAGYFKWVKEGTICEGSLLCEVERKYTGTSIYNITARTDTTRLTNCAYSSTCGEECRRWVDTHETYCDSGKMWKVEVEEVSRNQGCTEWERTCNKRLGAEVADVSGTCSAGTVATRWVADSGYICKYATKYNRLRLETSTDGTNWTPQDTYKMGSTAIEQLSRDCGWDDIISSMYQEWIYDGDMCDGFTKYERNRMVVSSTGREPWSRTSIVDWDTEHPLQVNSPYCGYNYGYEYTFRWALSNTCTICDGTTSYYMYVKQRSSDNGSTWEDVIPSILSVNAEGTKDRVVEAYNARKCGYIPPAEEDVKWIETTTNYVCDECGLTQYRWVNIDISVDYYCQGTTKLYKMKKQQSSDGVTWVDVSLAQYQMGDTAQTQSTDCGYAPEAQYRWTDSGYTCDGYDKYILQVKEISTDGGSTWSIATPTQTRYGSFLESNSEYCGYVPPTPIVTQYRWTNSGTTCDGFDKRYLQVYEQSTDNGTTWTIVTPVQTRLGNLIEANSADCGYEKYKNQYLTARITNGNGKLGISNTNNSMQYSLNSGSTWTTISTATTNSTIELNSGDVVMLRGNMIPTSGNGIGTIYAASYSNFEFELEGNIMSLLYGGAFLGKTSLSGKDWAFAKLLNSNQSLVKIENLRLPATTLSKYCYYEMFNACKKITKGTELPSLVLTEGCYNSMFYNCSGLTETPVLSAETLVKYCYNAMFMHCSALNKVTCLATNISAEYSTALWLDYTASSGTFYKAPLMTNWTVGSGGIPSGWTVRDVS